MGGARRIAGVIKLMPSITLLERDLIERSDALHEMFAPLRRGKPRIAIGFAKDSPGGTRALVATDGNVAFLRYRDESFRTSTRLLRCQYFELWRSSTRDKLALDRAYFTLLRVEQREHLYQELLCIHADPTDKNDLKQGPHLHMSCAPIRCRTATFRFHLASWRRCLGTAIP